MKNVPKVFEAHSSYYNQYGEAISHNAYHALYALAISQKIGRNMVYQYLKRRGVPLYLFCMARQLAAVQNSRFPI